MLHINTCCVVTLTLCLKYAYAIQVDKLNVKYDIIDKLNVKYDMINNNNGDEYMTDSINTRSMKHCEETSINYTALIPVTEA